MTFPCVIISDSTGSFLDGAMFLDGAIWCYAARSIGKERWAGWIKTPDAWFTIQPSELESELEPVDH